MLKKTEYHDLVIHKGENNFLDFIHYYNAITVPKITNIYSSKLNDSVYLSYESKFSDNERSCMIASRKATYRYK